MSRSPWSMLGAIAAVVLTVEACNDLPAPTDLTRVGGEGGAKRNTTAEITAAPISPFRIDVAWLDNARNETGFELHRSTPTASGPFTHHATTAANVSAFSDAGLAPSTQYCYKARSFRTSGSKISYAAFTSISCATTSAPPVPAAPASADAIPTNSSTVFVRWTEASGDESGFRVERSLDYGSTWSIAATASANSSSINDAGLTSDRQVCYRVIAFNSWGDSSPSNTDCAIPPAGPTGLAAAAVAGVGVDLAWTDNSTVEESYEVLRANDGFGPNVVAVLPANATSHRDTTAHGSLAYSYYVIARRDGGASDPSETTPPVASCTATSDAEICDNGNDDNCDGLVDTGDAVCPRDCGHGCYVGEICVDGFCVSHCGDGVQNGNESDVDCGGDCANCAAGQHCWVHADCESDVCSFSVCLAAVIVGEICETPGGVL